MCVVRQSYCDPSVQRYASADMRVTEEGWAIVVSPDVLHFTVFNTSVPAVSMLYRVHAQATSSLCEHRRRRPHRQTRSCRSRK